MKNLPRILFSGLPSQKRTGVPLKETAVEGLVLDQATRWPMEGVKIAVYICSEEGESVMVHEMLSDNNGYFSGSFQAEANTFIITPLKEQFSFAGSYTILKKGERAFECELVKHGKKQFYTLSLDGREGAKMAVTKTRAFWFKDSVNAFTRRLTALPLLRGLFS